MAPTRAILPVHGLSVARFSQLMVSSPMWSSTEPLGWLMNFRLTSPVTAAAVADAYNNAANSSSPTAPYLLSWQGIARQAGRTVSTG